MQAGWLKLTHHPGADHALKVPRFCRDINNQDFSVQQAVEIQKRVGDLGRHLNAYQEHMNKVGNHLSTTVNAYNNAGKEYGKIDKDVIKISDGQESVGADIGEIERPKSFEEQASSVSVKITGASKTKIAKDA